MIKFAGQVCWSSVLVRCAGQVCWSGVLVVYDQDVVKPPTVVKCSWGGKFRLLPYTSL